MKSFHPRRLRAASLLALFLLLTSITSAQKFIFPPFPQCANKCLQRTISASSCDATDYTCLCSDPAFSNNVVGCATSHCAVVDLLTVTNATRTGCGVKPRRNTTVTPVVIVVSGGLALVAVMLRLADRKQRGALQWAADSCVVAAMAWALIVCAFEILMVANGSGRDMWTLSQENINRVFLYTWIAGLSYIPTIWLPKIAILLWYISIFPGHSMRQMCLFTIVWCISVMLSTFAVTMLACQPIQFIWLGWAREIEGTCISINIFWYAQASINILSDLVVIAIPLPVLYKLQLSMGRKMYLICMFCLGFCITILSMVRFTGLVAYSRTTNPTYDNIGTAMWSILESHVSIMSCCMPSVVPLVVKGWERARGQTIIKWRSNMPREESKGGELATFGRGARDTKPMRQPRLHSFICARAMRLDEEWVGDCKNRRFSTSGTKQAPSPDPRLSTEEALEGSSAVHQVAEHDISESTERLREDFESDEAILPSKQTGTV